MDDEEIVETVAMKLAQSHWKWEWQGPQPTRQRIADGLNISLPNEDND